MIIKPLIFKAPSEQTKTYNFVEPYCIDSSVRPVTDDDIKTLKTYLNAIIKLDRYHGTANVAEITKQGGQINTQSSADVAEFLRNHQISYDMFDNQDLENALKQCEQCKPAPQEAKTKEKAIKFLQTLIKQPLINKKASKKVTDYLNAQKITYSAVSKKSLRKAIKDCKNKPVCQNFNKEDKQNAINYLTGLLRGKKARGLKRYQDVRNDYASKVTNILANLDVEAKHPVIQTYLRKEHTDKLQAIEKTKAKEIGKLSYTSLVKSNPQPENLEAYDNACGDLLKTIQSGLEALKNDKKNIASTYKKYKSTLTHGAGENASDPGTAIAVRKLKKEANEITSVTHGMGYATKLVGVFDTLVAQAEKILNDIEPLAAHLKRWSGKARMLGKTTLYTKMSDSLNEQLENVRSRIKSLLSEKDKMLCIGFGLMYVDEQGTVYSSSSSVEELLSGLEDLNNANTSLYNRIYGKEALTGSYDDLIKRQKKQSKTISELTGQIIAVTKKLDEVDLMSDSNAPGMAKFVLKMSQILDKASSSITRLSGEASGIHDFIHEAEHSVVGRIALFKEKHRVSIDTAKALTQVVKQVVDTIPK